MKIILKKGYKKLPEDYVYIKKCDICGCEFTYQVEDIEYDLELGQYIKCPDCDYDCRIIYRKKYKGDKNEKN